MYPLIGILAEVDEECASRVQNPYVSAIEKAGGIPLLLPYVEREAVIEAFVQRCDGFFFTGGVDVEPSRYGAEKSDACGVTQPNRDALEFRVLEKAMRTAKPILGICRGAQLINAALGGTLYQDIPSEIQTTLLHRQTQPKFAPSHGVNVLADTPLARLIGADRMVANSFHHQAIKTLGKGLEIMALADDGVIEAVYLPGDRYLRAYQWHPERLFDTSKENRTLFLDFLDACRSDFSDSSAERSLT